MKYGTYVYGFSLFALLTSPLFAYDDVFSTSEQVRVIKSEPVYKTVNEQRPIKECWDEREEFRHNSSGDIVGGIVGGALGGVLGNQIGRGSGKTAATIGGAAVGAMLGENLNQSSSPEERVVRRCQTCYVSQTRQIVDGYNNYAMYHGRQVVKYSHEPLEYINIYTDVSY